MPPTEVELEILNVLWELKRATAREVHDKLASYRTTNYSTTVKMLAVMFDKELIKRDESIRPMQFYAAAPQRRTQTNLLRSLIQRAYDGSVGSLVLQALSSKRATADELAEIRRLLDQLETSDEPKEPKS